MTHCNLHYKCDENDHIEYYSQRNKEYFMSGGKTVNET